MGLIFHVVVLIAEGISLAFLGFSLLVGIQALTGLAEESASIFVDEDAECPVLDGFDFPCSGPHR
jgi:hypothetical protein